MDIGIISQQDGAVLRITLNRPESGNRMSDAMTAELTRLIDGAAATSQFVVLRGAGADFCVGWGEYGSMPRPGSIEAYERLKKYDTVFNCYGAFRRSKVPILGIVQGIAAGFGCAVAALSDITIACESARFQVPELAHRILPTMVMSSLIDRVPLKAINYLVCTAEEIDARSALQYGLVSKVVADSGLEEATEAMCATLLRAPRPALIGLKEYARSAIHMDAQGAVDFARNLHATINTSSEMRTATG